MYVIQIAKYKAVYMNSPTLSSMQETARVKTRASNCSDIHTGFSFSTTGIDLTGAPKTFSIVFDAERIFSFSRCFESQDDDVSYFREFIKLSMYIFSVI